ncbi:MAG: hypothetical protein IKG40_01755 [Bacilli bacterium]|nr:hypothetical protein [Bacilli bacterium]
MNDEVITDIINYFKLIGGADELSDRGWETSAIMDDSYMESLEEFEKKYLSDEYENGAILKIDDALNVEKLLTNKFIEMMKGE